MPALRNRQQAKQTMASSSKQASNGMSAHQTSSSTGGGGQKADSDSYDLKKKLILLDEERRQDTKVNNDNNNNNNAQDDSFADTFTLSAVKHQDEPVEVFGGRQEVATSIGQSAKDQFAVALLRLQTDLDASSRRLTELEAKLEQSVQKQRQQQQQQASPKANRKDGPFSGKGNVASIIYLTWPVLVFFAMRAIERRSLSAKLA